MDVHPSDPGPVPDYAGLIAGHTAVIEMLNAGKGVLPALNHLLGVAQRTLRAGGITFTEYGLGGGRIIAATEGCEWAIGWPVDPTHPATARLLAGPRHFEGHVDALAPDLAHRLQGRGLRRVLVVRAEIAGPLVGTLNAYYSDPDGHADDELRTILSYVASCFAHLYGDQAGLPGRGDAPVISALADGLAIVDRNGTVLLWNAAAEQVTGAPAAKVLGQQLPFPAPPSGQVTDHRMPDGRWLRVTAEDLPGAAESRVVTFRDSTEQHRRDRDRDLFFAVTSHELRSPVTVIKGYADTLTNHWESLADPARREAVRVLGQRAGELARLVDRLLSSASDAEAVDRSPATPFDLIDGLRVAVAALPAELRRRLRAELPGELPKALGDRASLATVLTELATNAHKYSALGREIELTAGADERSVFFCVSDRGTGVRPEHVERAFDRFWQGESGDRRRYPGAGLGLFLVRRIVERQSGWVSLRPREGGGTVVEVRLPRGDVTLAGGA